ncbi:DUF3137 domain-containing protein [Rubritalea marina]|uniref:DUF3137 domain-containing protein n=1 Tax=Rubritalea marina TaxID=361055 RepID=UPI00035D3226|nr:DUF3137 domain-containing protein [Rubritalea marina]
MILTDEIKQELAPCMNELESIRHEANATASKGRQIQGVVALIGVGVALASFLSKSPQAMAVAISAAVVTIVISMCIEHYYVTKPRKHFATNFKSRIFTKLVSTLLPGFRYDPFHGISKQQFRASGLINSRIDRYHSEDFFDGKVGATELSFAECKAERKETRTDSKGRTRTTWVTVFDGIYLEADFHKHFSTRVTVMPDFAERTFGWLGKKMQALGGKVVHLEDPEFEKHFVVRGDDPIETRYILTPAMMQRILELKSKFGSKVMLSFQHSKLILMIESDRNWFEPDHKSNGIPWQRLESFLSELRLITSTVEDLDLNTRIWTKE